MTTYLGKSCSFGLPRVPFVNCGQFMYLVISLFGFEGRMWDLIVSVPDHCLSFYFPSVSVHFQFARNRICSFRLLQHVRIIQILSVSEVFNRILCSMK